MSITDAHHHLDYPLATLGRKVGWGLFMLALTAASAWSTFYLLTMAIDHFNAEPPPPPSRTQVGFVEN